VVEGALIRPCHAVSFFAVDRNLNLAVASNKRSEAHSVSVLKPNNNGLIYLVEEHNLSLTPLDPHRLTTSGVMRRASYYLFVSLPVRSWQDHRFEMRHVELQVT
jgi:hypothetical protein